jgi:urease accessory protein
MTRLVAKLKTARNAYKLEIKGKLSLPYAERQLPKGEALRGGDLATADDGHVYEIVAAPEKVLHIDCPQPREAAIVGYVLGNGHVPAQIGKGFVRIVHVPELEEAFPSLGVKVSQVEAPFEPDLGQAQHHHHHHHHDHDHDHPHDH